jgi:4-diphosphocytidyl-2-C-methyl-D-erythritol kinase
MPASLRVNAPAKLNVALSVGPPGRDGMHPISSWMITVDLFDELLLTRLEDDRLSRYAILWHKDAKRRSEINWSITKDLAVRAHLALEEHVGRHLPVQLKLEKRIPVGGGLGGGSSDAAAMLRALNELFELDLPLEELAAIGAKLGSDVPFLVHGGSAIVEGMGDQIQRHERTPMLHAVLALPDAICPTGGVYKLFDEFPAPELRSDAVQRLSQMTGTLRPDAPFNDLAKAAMRIAPRLQTDLADIARIAERPAHITGSGSSLFVICDDQMHAIALCDAVERKLNIPSLAVTSCTIAHGSRILTP